MKSLIELVIGIAIIWFVFSVIGNFGKYEGLTAEDWFNEYDQSEADLENYKTALEEANYNIEEANSMIENARRCSWGCDYEEMQDALNDLDTIDTVDEP